MRLKIIHITQFLGVGGLEKVLELLIEEQINAGHEVKLIVYDYERSWVEHFRRKGIIVETDYAKKDGYDSGLLRYLAKKIAQADIVHTHDINPALYISPLKILFKLTDRKFPRFIHTAHGMDHIHQRPITKVYEAFISRISDLTVGVGSAVCDVYRKLLLAEEKIKLIENGTRVTNSKVDKKNAKAKICQELNLNLEAPLWGAVARIVPLKNQKLILALAKSYPQINFLLVGPSGEEGYWNELQKNKTDNVIMLGARSDIPEILAAMDVFISASTHEGIPLSVLEAGAFALPCLLSNISGHKTLQDTAKEKIAYYFNSGDLVDLSLKTETVLKNNSTDVGKNLYLHISNYYSSQAMYQKYLQAYLGNYV